MLIDWQSIDAVLAPINPDEFFNSELKQEMTRRAPPPKPGKTGKAR